MSISKLKAVPKLENRFSLLKEAERIVITPNEYDKLGFVKSNRPINQANLKSMADSVLRNGCLRDVIVIWSDEEQKYLIVDGQHLTIVLKELNANITCRVINLKEDELTKLMIDINNTGKAWTLLNYITGWAENGNPNYKKLGVIIKKSEVQDSVIVMAYTQKDRHSACKLVKSGAFAFKANKKVGDTLVKRLTECHEYVPNTRVFNQALMLMFIKLAEYDHAKMLRNLKRLAPRTKFSFKEKELYDQLINIYCAK